jgi:hypothetical protein
MEKIWKDIKGYEGRYIISTTGEVASLFRKDEIITLSPFFNEKGYVRVKLNWKGKSKNFAVHRLVAETFIENLENKQFVNHKNGIKHDNSLENLEWCTASENMRHSFDVLKQDKGHSPCRPVFKYDFSGNLLDRFTSCKEAGIKENIKASTISNCCLGRSKTNKGFVFSYKELPLEYFNQKLGLTYNKKAISKFKNGNLIDSYESVKEAAIQNKMSKHEVKNLINGKTTRRKFDYQLSIKITRS